MNSSTYKMSQQLSDEINRLMEEEKHAVEYYQERADTLKEPLLKSLYEELVNVHVDTFSELKARSRETPPEEIVVKQINEMFL